MTTDSLVHSNTTTNPHINQKYIDSLIKNNETAKKRIIDFKHLIRLIKSYPKYTSQFITIALNNQSHYLTSINNICQLAEHAEDDQQKSNLLDVALEKSNELDNNNLINLALAVKSQDNKQRLLDKIYSHSHLYQRLFQTYSAIDDAGIVFNSPKQREILLNIALANNLIVPHKTFIFNEISKLEDISTVADKAFKINQPTNASNKHELSNLRKGISRQLLNQALQQSNKNTTLFKNVSAIINIAKNEYANDTEQKAKLFNVVINQLSNCEDFLEASQVFTESEQQQRLFNQAVKQENETGSFFIHHKDIIKTAEIFNTESQQDYLLQVAINKGFTHNCDSLAQTAYDKLSAIHSHTNNNDSQHSNNNTSRHSFFYGSNDGQDIIELIEKNKQSPNNTQQAIHKLNAHPQKADYLDRYHQCLLHYAAFHSNSSPLIAKLVEKAPKYLNQANSQRYTPLHCAACNEKPRAIRAL